MLAQGDFFASPRVPEGASHTDYGHTAFQPLGFVMDKDAPRMAPTYPIGLPLHLMVAARIGGWDHAVTIVNLFGALASGALLWLLARHLQFPPAWRAVAVGALWLCPLVIFCALQPMSDLLATVWSLIVLYTALRNRAHAGWSIACGAALSIAVLVRPTNALLLAPVVFALGLRPQNLLALSVGGAPGALLLGYYNHRVYGSAFTTGYGSVESAFSAGFVPHNLGHMAFWIPALLSPLVCAALAVPFLAGPRRRDAQVLGLWVATLIAFYAFYYHTGETWWYLRFILPAFPLLILGMLAVLEKIPARLPRYRPFLLLGIAAVAFTWETSLTRRLDPTGIVQGEQTYPLAAAWAKQHLPPESAIACMQVSGALHFYTNFMVVRWDQIANGRVAPLLEMLQARHHPLYAILYPFETKDALARLGGEWEKIGEAGKATVWRKKN